MGSPLIWTDFRLSTERYRCLLSYCPLKATATCCPPIGGVFINQEKNIFKVCDILNYHCRMNNM